VLIDRYGRKITTLRISITDRCNLKCIYCHREGFEAKLGELSIEELLHLVKAGVKLGISRVKLTGGEPLVRRDVVELVKQLSSIPGVAELSMTTNGTLLAEYAEPLAEAGLKRVNVNLPSLNPQRYVHITGRPLLEEVKKGIRRAVEVGLWPVKVNMVVLKGLNDDEIPAMIEFTGEVPAILQLIELERLGNAASKLYDEHYYDLSKVEEWLSEKAVKVIFRSLHNRRKYVLDGGQEVEVVRPLHGPGFCRGCTRIRLTSDGRIKPCLMREDNVLDARDAMKRGDIKALEELLRKAVELREPYCL